MWFLYFFYALIWCLPNLKGIIEYIRLCVFVYQIVFLCTYFLCTYFCPCKYIPQLDTQLNHLMDLWFSWLGSLGLFVLLAAILLSLLLSFTVISTWLLCCDRSDYRMCSKYGIKDRTVTLIPVCSDLLTKAIWGSIYRCTVSSNCVGNPWKKPDGK